MNIEVNATMKGVGEIKDTDRVFIVVERIASDGSVMSREKYPATFTQEEVE